MHDNGLLNFRVRPLDWKHESFEWNKALSNIKKIKDKQESSAEDYAPR